MRTIKFKQSIFKPLILFVSLYWTGIYFNVNRIAPVSALLLISVGVVLTLLGLWFCVKFARGIFGKTRKRLRRGAVIGIICAALFAVGVGRTVWFDHAGLCDVRNFFGQEVTLYGRICADVTFSQSQKNFKYTIFIEQIDYDGTSYFGVNDKVIVYAARQGNKELSFGEKVEVKVRLDEPAERLDESNFNYKNYLKANDVLATGLFAKVKPSDFPSKKLMWPDKLGHIIRRSINLTVGEYFDENKDIRSLIQGILIGNVEDFSADMKEDLSRSGIAHITSVSGLHVSLLFMAVMWLMTKLRVRKLLTHLLSIPIFIVFMFVCQQAPSVKRSVIMVIVFILTNMINRENDGISSLCIAGLVITLENPYTLFSASFVLSFSATLGIFVFFPLLRPVFSFIEKLPWLRRFPKTTRGIKDSIAVSSACTICSAPFLIYYFGYVSLAGLLLNIFIGLCVAVVFIGGYALCLINLVPFLKFIGIAGSFLIAGCAKVILVLAEAFAKLPFAVFEMEGISAAGVFIYYAAAGALYFMLNLDRGRGNIHE